MNEFVIKCVDYHDPDAQKLIAEVQAEYAEIYGSPDEAPIEDQQFREGKGEFFVGYLDGEAIATGAWRRFDADSAEIKRMYVVRHRRREGFSKRMLAHVENAIASAGIAQAILETGSLQTPAVAMYQSSGYQRIAPFGYYADPEDFPEARHFGKDLGQ